MDRMKLPEARTEHLFYLETKQAEDVLVKNNGKGELLFSPIIGGHFEGKKLKGTVMPIGTGTTLTTERGRNDIEIKLLLKTDDGEDIVLGMRGTAYLEAAQEEKMLRGESVDAADYYYRFNLTFETGSKAYEWLNGKCCFAVAGIKDWETVCCDAYMVL